MAGHGITGTSGADQTNLNFGNFELFNISGYKWGDVDGDGTWNEADNAGLTGWTIVLDRDNIAGNNNEIATDVTDADGFYSFTGLGPGSYGGALVAGQTYYVYELQNQDGFTQTFNGGFSFTLQSGVDLAGDLGEAEEGNFGNHMMAGANRTPGFWQSTLGKSLYDGNNFNNGDANGDGKPDGNKDFAAEGWSTTDLLSKYGVDKVGGDGINDTFIVWDADRDGNFDSGHDVFLSANQLAKWVGTTGNHLQMLERDVGATFLNTLNNHALTTLDQSTGDKFTGMDAMDGSIIDSFEDAIAYLLKFDSDLNGVVPGSKKQVQALLEPDWNGGIGGSAAHVDLAAYNESGEIMDGSTLKQVAMDGDDYSSSLVQDYLAVAHFEYHSQDLLSTQQTTVVF
jgi:hypothetical protein